jgi:AraC family transcriptional regulator
MDHYLPAVHRALAFMEENLKTPVTLERIARRAGFSLWHFQRIFAAYTNESLADYLRRRRLTVAVLDIRNTGRSILGIALDYQFESHAAFTRAFKATLHAAPSSFRRHRALPEDGVRLALSPSAPLIPMKPRIQKLPALTLLGLEARFIGPMSPDANNHKVIPPLFGQFFAHKPELPPALDACTYGVTRGAPRAGRSREDELVYLVSESVKPRTRPPAGMTIWRLPAQTYAIFVHRGPVVRIDRTLNEIYSTWLPQSPYQLAGEGSIERYDERFREGGAKSEFDILIPVKLRTKK